MSLIPRYNWDYDLSDCFTAVRAVFSGPPSGERSLENIFGETPVLTTSGRVSLYLILRSLQLPEGSPVGVPLFVCPIVFEAVREAGLAPVFLDVDMDDYTLSVRDLQKKRNSLAAVIAVHMFGHPADMDEISRVCGDIPVIEDCAQALFSRYKGEYAGFLSAASFFSFRSGKYVSAGEGSAIFSRDPELLNAIREAAARLPEWSMTRELIHCASVYLKSTLYHRPWYGLVGRPLGAVLDRRYNLTAKTGISLFGISRCDRAVMERKIRDLLPRIDRQRRNSLYLLENLRLGTAVLPREKPGCTGNFFQFAIRLPDRETRDRMSAYLVEHGIDSARYLDDVADIARKRYGYRGDCPDAEHCAQTVLVIPNYYTLKESDLGHMVSALNAFPGTAGHCTADADKGKVRAYVAPH
jgi:dTDP-4-amino-4,6-dideoxygalactose transaminase